MYDIRPLIRALDDRMRYLLAECPPREFNTTEMAALMNLLKEYDPGVMNEPCEHKEQYLAIHIDPKIIIALLSVMSCVAVLTFCALFETDKE